MRGDGLPDNKAVIDRLSEARDTFAGDMPGKPAITVPIDSLHFYRDDNGTLLCVIDMEQIVFLADDMLRKRP
jgi:hypothetical protein